jgi:transcriptional regulator with XRE-family HTH domain
VSESAWRETVGKAIRRQRLAFGMTQGDLAHAIGASGASISCWESGNSTLSAYWHAKLKTFFADETVRRQAATPKKSKSAQVPA